MRTASHDASASSSVARDDRLVVARDPEVDGFDAGVGEQGEQHRPVRVADLPGRERPARSTSSSPVEQHPDAGASDHGDLARARGSRARRGARDRAPCRPRTRAAPASRSPPAGRTWSPAVAACSTRTPSSSSRAVRSTMTIASAPSGIGAPVMIRIASPGPTGTVGACPAGSSPTTCSRTGAPAAAPDGVGGAHRVAVHRGVRERRDRLAGDDVGSASTSPSASRQRRRPRSQDARPERRTSRLERLRAGSPADRTPDHGQCG